MMKTFLFILFLHMVFFIKPSTASDFNYSTAKSLIIRDLNYLNSYLYSNTLSNIDSFNESMVEILTVDSAIFLFENTSLYKVTVKFSNCFFSNPTIENRQLIYYIGDNGTNYFPLFGFYKCDIHFLWPELMLDNNKLNMRIIDALSATGAFTKKDIKYLKRTLRNGEIALDPNFSKQCNVLKYYFTEDKSQFYCSIIPQIDPMYYSLK